MKSEWIFFGLVLCLIVLVNKCLKRRSLSELAMFFFLYEAAQSGQDLSVVMESVAPLLMV